MRFNRIKFKEIDELKSWIVLLMDEREYNSVTQSKAQSKINSGEYAEEDIGLFAITRDELRQQIRRAEYDNELISNLIMSKKLELRLKFQELERLKSKYDRKIISFRYQSNKTEFKSVFVGDELLGKIVKEIGGSLELKKNAFSFYILFDDDSILTKYIGMDKLKEVQVRG